MNVPERTLDQRLIALERANEIRSRRAVLKRDLKAGRVTVAEVIESTEGWLQTMRVFDVLVAVPKLGRVKVNRALVACRVSPSKTLGGLSERQREELLTHLDTRHPRALRQAA